MIDSISKFFLTDKVKNPHILYEVFFIFLFMENLAEWGYVGLFIVRFSCHNNSF